MSRPIFTEAATTFADDLLGAAESVARVLRDGAPEPVIVSVSERHTTITPWLPGAPLTGLLAWAAHLTDLVWSAYVHTPPTAGSPAVVSLYCNGQLAGRPVELVGGTHRPLRSIDPYYAAGRQPVDPAEVTALAANEEPPVEVNR